MAMRHMGMGLGEIYRSFSKPAFLKALQRLIPDLRTEDLEEGGCGVRAQAMLPDGRLEDDFRIVTHGRAIHVLNAPSPAATASLAIGDRIAARVLAMRA
jgi:L-2-hydroxyglutarate oxidase